jgi:hypothetical protein
VADALRQVDGLARRRTAKAVIAAKVGTYEQGGTTRVPGVARCIAGTKKGHLGGTTADCRDECPLPRRAARLPRESTRAPDPSRNSRSAVETGRRCSWQE